MFESIKRLFTSAPAAAAAAPPSSRPPAQTALNNVLKGVTSTFKKIDDKAHQIKIELVAEAKAVWNNDKPKLGPTGQYLAQKLSPLKHKVDQAATALNNEAAKFSHATQHVAHKVSDVTHKVVGDVKTALHNEKAKLDQTAQHVAQGVNRLNRKVVDEVKTALNSKPALKDFHVVQVAHAEPGNSAAARSQPAVAKPQAGPAPLEAFKPPTRAQVQARQDAIELYQAGIARMGTDEKKITDILKSYNPQQMETLRQQYRAEYDRELDADLKSEYGIVKHDIADLFAGTKNEQAELKVLLQGTAGADAQKPRGHAAAKEDAADQLMRAMKGWGTDEKLIGQVLQGKQKAEIDQIAADYEKRYGKSLHQSLVDEISPNSTDYKKLIEQDFKLGAVDFNKPAEAAKELARRSQDLLDYQPRYTRVLQDAAERTWNAIINDGIEGPLRTSREQAQYDLDRVQQHLSQGQAGPAALQAGVTRRQVDVVQETQQDMAKAAAYTAASLAGGFAGVAVRGAMGAAAGTLAGQAASGAASVGAGMVAGGATYGTLNPHAGAEEITRQSVLSGVAGGSALAGTSLGSAVTLPQAIGAGAKVGFATGAAHGALDAATDQVTGQDGAGQWARKVAERSITEGTTGAFTLGAFGGLKYGMSLAPAGGPPHGPVEPPSPMRAAGTTGGGMNDPSGASGPAASWGPGAVGTSNVGGTAASWSTGGTRATEASWGTGLGGTSGRSGPGGTAAAWGTDGTSVMSGTSGPAASWWASTRIDGTNGTAAASSTTPPNRIDPPSHAAIPAGVGAEMNNPTTNARAAGTTGGTTGSTTGGTNGTAASGGMTPPRAHAKDDESTHHVADPKRPTDQGASGENTAGQPTGTGQGSGGQTPSPGMSPPKTNPKKDPPTELKPEKSVGTKADSHGVVTRRVTVNLSQAVDHPMEKQIPRTFSFPKAERELKEERMASWMVSAIKINRGQVDLRQFTGRNFVLKHGDVIEAKLQNDEIARLIRIVKLDELIMRDQLQLKNVLTSADRKELERFQVNALNKIRILEQLYKDKGTGPAFPSKL